MALQISRLCCSWGSIQVKFPLQDTVSALGPRPYALDGIALSLSSVKIYLKLPDITPLINAFLCTVC
jgi:hypothetical protein